MKSFIVGALLALALPFATPAVAADITVDQLRDMSQTSLNQVYLNAVPGPLPDGQSNGTAVFFPGTLISTPTQILAALIWQGKVFDTDDGILNNRVFGFRAIKAKVYYGKSLFDGKESIIIDYSRTSLLAHKIRDEIRLVAPNLYLGRAYLRTWIGDYMVVNFILDFNN